MGGNYVIERNGIAIEITAPNEPGQYVWYGGESELTYHIMDSLYKHRGKVVGGSVLDVGTGTGVMAIYASKLGAKSVLATDISDDAIKCAISNIARNNVDVAVIKNDLTNGITDRYDVIIANLPMAMIRDNLDTIMQNLNDDGILLCTWDNTEPCNYEYYDRLTGKDFDGLIFRRSK